MRKIIDIDARMKLIVVGVFVGIVSVTLASLFQDKYGIADWRSRYTGFLDLIAIIILMLARSVKTDKIKGKVSKSRILLWTSILRYMFIAGLLFMLLTKVHITMVLLLSR